MEMDWDKEFDSLLRHTAQGETVSDRETDDLDADEIAAFAENLLPPDARARVAAKLADSAHGRQILSNLILINETAENEEKKVSETAEKAMAIAPKISLSDYFSQFFTLKTLGFVGAALSVILIGSFAFIVFRSNQASELAMSPEEKPYLKSPQSAMNANASSSNTASVANTTANSAPIYSANSASNVAKEASNTEISASNTTRETQQNREITASNRVAMGKEEESKKVAVGGNKLDEPTDKTPLKDNEKDELAKPVPPPAPPQSVASAPPKPTEELKPQPTPSTKLETANEQKRAETNNDSVAGYSAKPKPAPATGATARRDQEDDQRQAKLKTSAKKKEDTRNLGGKNFRRENGAWVDSAYNSQATQNVSRGSEEYKKLDSGLRSIAENLGGTVIIVWQGRAYRIN